MLVVAATRATRTRLEALVGAAPGLHLVGGDAGMPLAQQVDDARPDVLLVYADGARLDRLLDEHARLPRAPAIVVLDEDGGAGARAVLGGRAHGRLPRAAGPAEVVPALEAVAAGLVVLTPDALVRSDARPAAAARPRAAAREQALTPRELEILGLLADGLHNRAIATRLGVSSHTVKFHLASLFLKLQVGTRAEAVSAGIRRGLIPI